MIKKLDKNNDRKARHLRVRKKVQGTSLKPRFNVYRSTKYIYVQIIDDINGVTLASANSLALAEKMKGKTKSEQAKAVGLEAGKAALAAGIKEVVFDRGGYIYTGRVQQIAEGAREAGLKF
jgi:large subunit ribosomal protein L18